ncbi:ATP-dependent RecD-like DNA helicase [Wansuia hejianensis]|uniref:ATP-dependent RecD2 DNA helicase n=1 Tax=Wansuia hejianensis TaxID=2763667 RepID=A0A926EW78_9FIRM|nr:ATP-dependent RecD-like DNA helicase [Wansuia hejianensis]MBC8590066.1 ATP-dependent RecD-like DNA helicase [Wansuia hejianensis]
MVIEGVIEEVIFRNETNGYTVAKLNTSDGMITIVGNVAFINLEEMVEVEGEWIYHNTFGEQFSFTSMKTTAPSTLKGIENYLASGLLPHVGPKTAKNIVNRFGLDSLEIIQYNPERLKEIPGIGEKKLEKIAKAYEEQREIKDIMVYLQQYDITVNYGIKIYKQYGKDTIAVISENPYRLSEDIYGIGFKTADNIAKKMGISHESPYRVEAGLKFAMMSSSGEGHCYLPKDELLNKTAQLLDIEIESIESSLRDLALKNSFQIIQDGEETIVYYTPLHMAENNVARKIVELSRVDFKDFEVNIDKKIKEIEKENNIAFGNKQITAIEESINSGVMIITGGPGTGKTTTINAIIKIYEDLGLNVVLAAPTGRAAKRMTETTGRESKTIHRLLEFSYMEEDMAFNKDEDSPIDGDVLIIDEASMIDILLMNSLLKAINPGTRLILVGDVDQLPSVGPGNVLKDIINSGSINVVMLDEIFRQAEESMIIVNAHRINKGENPLVNEKDKDFYFIVKNNTRQILDTIVNLNKDRLPNFYDVDPVRDIQVLTPMKKGEVGINSLNKHLQNSLNPKSKDKEEKQIGDEVFRVGDKVMQIKNNYNTEWKIIKDGLEVEKGEGVFNGDFGFIIDIDNEDRTLRVLFDDEKEVEYDFNQLDELKLAYATTIHKAQGSEFPVVIMPIHWGPPMLLTRNLIYTAITRARQLVVLVGQEKYLYMMINNNKIAKRYSSLDRKIREFITTFYM